MEFSCNLNFYQRKNITTLFKETVLSLVPQKMRNNSLYIQTCLDMPHYHCQHSILKFNFYTQTLKK